MQQPDAETSAKAVRDNIDAIARLEQSFHAGRTASERFADAVGGFFGTLRFIVAQTVAMTLWILWNSGRVPGVRVFDPFPFLLLNMAMSVEAILLSAFVLIKQDRMSRRADQRAHLDLHVNLLAEREMTLVLQMLSRISTRLGLRTPGDAVEELCEETSIEVLASELKDKLPAE